MPQITKAYHFILYILIQHLLNVMLPRSQYVHKILLTLPIDDLVEDP